MEGMGRGGERMVGDGKRKARPEVDGFAANKCHTGMGDQWRSRFLLKRENS